MTHKEQCEALVARVQAVKAPIDGDRVARWNELASVLASIRERESALRAQIKELHGKVQPLEELMASILAAKSMKGDMAAKVLAELTEQVEAL